MSPINPDETINPASQPAAPVISLIEYPITTKALAKWLRLALGRRTEPDGAWHYTYRFMGSTCSNGGQPVNTIMHAIVRARPAGVVLENGWIEFADDDTGHRSMCDFIQRGPDFLDELRRPPAFCGQTLEAIIAQSMPINPAGCVCKPPMINHKWRQMLCTIHYGLALEATP